MDKKSSKKPILVRVITDGRVLPWHLEKTLRDLQNDFTIFIVGEDVSSFRSKGLSAEYRDIPITPKVNILKDMYSVFALAHLLHRIQPDIVHSIMPKAGLISAIASYFFAPVRIHTFTGQVWQRKKGVSRVFLKWIDRVIISLNSVCLTDSPSQSEFLFSEGVVLKSGQALPYLSKGSLGGVDLLKINIRMKETWRREIRERYGIVRDSTVIGYLARKTIDKGAIRMLQVFSRLRDHNQNVVLLFVGPDDSGSDISNYVESHPSVYEGVIDVGAITEHEKYLAAFDVLCLPSFREGFGSIVIDAAAMGCPSVGSKIPGLVDAVVNGETGLTFEAGNIQEFFEALVGLVEDPSLIERLGSNAYSRVLSDFDSRVISGCQRAVYLEKISSGSAGG